MKFYSRQINSLKELKAEQARLKARVSDTSHRAASADGDGKLDFLLSILSNDIVLRALVKLGFPMLKKAGGFAGKNAFMLGKEVFGGYAKWKLLELGFRFVRRKWQQKREEKAAK